MTAHVLLILPPRCVQVVQCLGSLPFTQSTLNPLPWSLHSRLCTCPGVSMSRCPVKLGQSPALPVKNALDCLSAPSGYDLAKTWPTVPCTAPSRTGLAHVQPNTGQLGRVGPPRALSRSGLAKTWQSWASQSPFTLCFGQNLANMPSATSSCSNSAPYLVHHLPCPLCSTGCSPRWPSQGSPHPGVLCYQPSHHSPGLL